MSRVLFGWELGGGHGHARKLLPVAKALKGRGHDPVFAVRNVADVGPMLRAEGFPVFAAPFWHDKRFIVPQGWAGARSFADILGVHGWDEPDELEGMIRAWDALIDLVRPALVVIDHAPSLALAAWKRIPAAQVGTGFTMPPADLEAYPPLNNDAAALVPEERILSSIAEVQRRVGRAAPAALAATLGHPVSFPTFFRELDPYAAGRREPPIGPIQAVPAPVPPPAASRWFAYLAADYAAASDVLLDLADTGIPGEAFSPGTPPDIRQGLRNSGVLLHDAPARMEDVFPRVSVVIHAGGAGLASSTLAAGRPQMLLPQHLEQRITARLLAGIGVAVSPGADEGPASLLRRLFKGTLYSLDARDRAEAIRSKGPWKALDGVTASLLDMLGA